MSSAHIRPIVADILQQIVLLSRRTLGACTLRTLRHQTYGSYEQLMVERLTRELDLFSDLQSPDIRIQLEVPTRVTRHGTLAKTSGRLDILVYVTDHTALVLEIKAVPLSRLVISHQQAEILLSKFAFQATGKFEESLTGLGADENVKVQLNVATKQWSIHTLPALLTEATTQASHYARDVLRGSKEDVVDRAGYLMYQRNRPLRNVFYAGIIFFGARLVVSGLLHVE